MSDAPHDPEKYVSREEAIEKLRALADQLEEAPDDLRVRFEFYFWSATWENPT